MTATSPVSLPPDARTVLLAVPGSVMPSTKACLTMAADRDFVDPLVLYFSFKQAPGTIVEQWHDVVDVPPAEFVVIDAREQGTPDASVDATVVSEAPNDLTWFGIHATEHLTRWHERDDPIVICFDSLSMLLQYSSPETVYRFLHVLTGRVENAGGTGFYHIDPLVNEDTVVNTMAQLCDCRISCDPDGEWSVRGR